MTISASFEFGVKRDLPLFATFSFVFDILEHSIHTGHRHFSAINFGRACLFAPFEKYLDRVTRARARARVLFSKGPRFNINGSIRRLGAGDI